MNEDNEDVGVIYIDSNDENDINLFQMDEDNMDESDMEWKKLSMFIILIF